MGLSLSEELEPVENRLRSRRIYTAENALSNTPRFMQMMARKGTKDKRAKNQTRCNPLIKNLLMPNVFCL